jgi:hypothetical protein
MKNPTTTMKISPSGQVSGVEVNGKPVKDPKMASSMSPMQLFNVLPQRPLSVGSSWDSSTDMAMMGELSVRNIVDHISTGSPTIVSFHSSGTVDASKLGMGMGGSKGSITYSTHTEFNVTQGFYLGSTIKGKINVDSARGGQSMHIDGAFTLDIKKTG